MGLVDMSTLLRRFTTIISSSSASKSLTRRFCDDYVLLEMLCKGEFSQVHVVGKVGRKESKAAVKILEVDAKGKDYLIAMREAQLHLRVNSEHVVKLCRVFSDNCRVHLIMELCESTLLQQLQKAQEDSKLNEAFLMEHVFRGVLSGLVCIHRAGVIHCDLKPGHILCSATGKPQICDFGLATDQGTMLPLGAVGTVPYMSPEILGWAKQNACGLSLLSEKTDVWSFGVLAYVLLLGDFPYSSDGGNEKSKAYIRTGAQRPTFVSLAAPGRASWQAEIFVRSLLVRPVHLRPSAHNALHLLPPLEALSTRPLERVLARATEVGAFEKGGSEGRGLGGACASVQTTQQTAHLKKPVNRHIDSL